MTNRSHAPLSCGIEFSRLGKAEGVGRVRPGEQVEVNFDSDAQPALAVANASPPYSRLGMAARK